MNRDSIEIEALVSWQRNDATFTDSRYSRAHSWAFDGGAIVQASSSPHLVPLPYSRAENVDPEEAYIAALSSCHMLMFLAIAAKAGHVVDTYSDRAVGTMGKNEKGQLVVDRIVLHPITVWSGVLPTHAELSQMHHQAHEQCFLANSVRTIIETRLG